MKTSRTHAIVAVVAAIACAACPQMAIVTGATDVAGAAADDRTLAQQGSDLDTKAGIEKALLSADPTLASEVNVDVYLGRIMLTGVVPGWEARRNAVEITHEAAPDRLLFDDIEVAKIGRAHV